MAADVSIASPSSNPCCSEIKEKYQKMEKKRNALKEAVDLLGRQMTKLETGKTNLKKAFKEEKKRGDLEREAKDKEITLRKTLENELRELKTQLSSLSQETKTLNPSYKNEEEIERLKNLLEEEKKINLFEKKKAVEAMNLLKLEKNKVEEEREKNNEFRVSFEKLQSHFEEVKDQFEKALEEEKLKVSKEKRVNDAEKVKLEAQKKIVEREKQRAIDEKKRADILMKKLEEERERNKDLQSKIASQNTQKEKIQIDSLLKKLEEEREKNKSLQTKIESQNAQKGILKKLEKEKEKNKKLQAKIDSLTSVQREGIMVNNANFEVKLLKEKLKFKKQQIKHVKNVLKLEKSNNSSIKQHCSLLKQDFMQLMNRFKSIDMHLGIEGTNLSTKEISRKSESLPVSGTSSELIPKNGQNNYKKNTDKKLLLGPQDRERDSSVSSPVLQIDKISGESLQNSLNPLKNSHKRKRNEANNNNNLDSKKKEKKVPNVNNNNNNNNNKKVDSDFIEFEKRVQNGGVLKLLEFENKEMEKRFLNAIERPLSPNIPQITPKILNNAHIAPKLPNIPQIPHGEMPNIPQITPREIPNIPKTQITPVKMVNKSNKENQDCFLVPHNSVEENENSIPKFDIFESPPDLMEIVTVNNCENSEGVNEKGDNLKGQIEKCAIRDYLIVFSSLKEESLERVKSTWVKLNFNESCKVGLSSRVLEVALESVLLSEERACIIYSLLSCDVCERLTQNSKNITDSDFSSYIGSFRDGIFAVISEEILNILAKNNILENMILLMEEFITHKQVLVYKNDEFCNEPPTKDQNASNCIILASICLQINRVDISLSTCYKILLEGKKDISQTLLLVHIFIYICKEKFFCHNQERFISRAIQWVVLRIEKNLGFFCEKCPFEMDDNNKGSFLDSLFDEVELCCLSRNPNPNPNPNPNFACGEDCSVYKAEINGLCHFTEIISLVELVANYMEWKDVYEKVATRLLLILEQCRNEEFSAALLVLIGHLARLGIDNFGYEQMQVSELRNKLSIFIKAIELKPSLPLQFASIGVLLNLIPFNFKEVLTGDDDDDYLSNKGEFGSEVGQIKRWFSHLNEEQKTVSHSMFSGL